MSKKTFRILAAIAVSGLAAAIILYYLPDFHYAADKTLDLLIADTLIRVFASFFLVLIVLSGREGAAFAIRREGLFRYLQRAGEHNWKAYHRHPGVRPFCWLYQVFRYIKKGMGRIGHVRSDLVHGNSRYELLKKLGIMTRT